MQTKYDGVSINSTSVSIKPILPIEEIQRITGKKRSTIYRWMEKGVFPKSTRLGPNSIGWPEEVISEWRENLINGKEV